MTERKPQFVLMLVARVGTLVMGVLTSVVVARALSPQERGTYYVAVSLATTALAVGHLSVEQAQTATWPEKARRSSLDANSVPLGLSVGTVAAVVAAVLGLVFQGHANLPDIRLLALACTGVPLGMGVLYATNITVLRRRSHVAAWSMLASGVVQCVCLAALALTGRLTVLMVVVAWVLSSAVSLTVLIAAGGVTVGRPDLRLAGSTCVKGLRMHAGCTATYLLLRSDVFLLNALCGRRDVGIYTLAVTLAELSRLAVDAFSQVNLSAQFDGDAGSSAFVTARLIRFMVLLAAASAVTTVAAVSALITPLYGPAYSDAAAVVAWLTPGVLLLSASRPLSSFLLRQGSPRLVILPSLVALVVNVGLNTVLIPLWGAVGCAIASTVAYSGLVAILLTFFSRRSGVGWRHLLPTSAEATWVTTEVRRRCRQLHIGRAA
ncbi:lipopolysaccharide biosynthesis protein [Streptomyces sp. NPDC003753]|uniref:lipopolysaccharide biosynthesis protein n=1 Tax=Streptomyces sp. NPDC058960 TaxID=3346679 RepID=UPI0036997130